MKEIATILVIGGIAATAIYILKKHEEQNKKLADMELKVTDLTKKVTDFNAQKYIKEL